MRRELASGGGEVVVAVAVAEEKERVASSTIAANRTSLWRGLRRVQAGVPVLLESELCCATSRETTAGTEDTIFSPVGWRDPVVRRDCGGRAWRRWRCRRPPEEFGR